MAISALAASKGQLKGHYGQLGGPPEPMAMVATVKIEACYDKSIHNVQWVGIARCEHIDKNISDQG